MKTVQQLMKVKPVDGDIGIEIELEGRDLPMTNHYWRMERDGSLQGESMEYVLRQPSSTVEASKALQYLQVCFKDMGTKINDTVRAGVHIHINCQKLTYVQLYNFFVLFMIMEVPLVQWCGEGRSGNLFCLRCKDADYLLSALREAVRTQKFVEVFKTDNLRYAAMNVKALAQYGSLEFRTLRSSSDLTRVDRWFKVLLNLRQHAERIQGPGDIISEFSYLGPHEFAKKYLGDFYKELKLETLEQDMHEGMRNAQHVAYSCENWDKLLPDTKCVGGLEFPVDADPFEPEEDF